MPQRKRPVDPNEGPVANLAYELQQLREAVGLTYDAMASRAHYSKTTLAAADSGVRLPTREVVLAYVAACNGDTEYFRRRWQEVAGRIGVHEMRMPVDRLAALACQPATQVPPPDPATAATMEEYRRTLKQLRVWAGLPTYRELSRRARLRGMHLPKSSLSDLLNGKRLGGDRCGLLATYLRVCGLDDDNVAKWLGARDALDVAGDSSGMATLGERTAAGAAKAADAATGRRLDGRAHLSDDRAGRFRARVAILIAAALAATVAAMLVIASAARGRPDPSPPRQPAVDARLATTGEAVHQPATRAFARGGDRQWVL